MTEIALDRENLHNPLMLQIMIHQNKTIQAVVHPCFWTFMQNRFLNGFSQIKQKIQHRKAKAFQPYKVIIRNTVLTQEF